MDARRIPFTEEDERRIASAATWGLIVSISSIATALVSLAFTALMYSEVVHLSAMLSPVFAVSALQSLITVLFNVWLLQASMAFRKVALTDEADQLHLLVGFRKLRAYFMIQVILIVLAAVGGFMMSMISGVF